MLFKAAVLDAIASGRVTLAFRRWKKPTVRAQGTLRTPVGVLAIDDVREVTASEITNEDAQAAGFENREEVVAELQTRRDGALYRIAFHLAGPDLRQALREAGELTSEDIVRLKADLARLDGSRGGSPWALQCLRLIGAADGRPAAELAEQLDLEKPTLKRKIRQLKELGLTESLQAGYRLSSRGRALLQALDGR